MAWLRLYLPPFLFFWLSACLSLYITDAMFEGVWLDGWVSLLVSGLILAFVNMFLKPILMVLTLPLMVFTLGLALPLLNGLLLMIVDELVLGFHLAGYGVAVVAALLISLISFLINLAIGRIQVRGRFGGRRARPPRSGSGAERTEASESYRGGATRSGRSHGYSSASRSDDVIDVEVHERKDP
ncbi:MAG: phage holin family protein [Burkholderiaceae bacterium]|jgi:putative membrane protein